MAENELVQNNDIEVLKDNSVATMVEELLLDVRKGNLPVGKTMSVPIGELSALGSGVSSLIPQFNTVTQTMTSNTDGLYRIVNMGSTDVLKVARNGNFWGAFKTAEGQSKFAQLAQVDSATLTNKAVMNANPATMLMGVALFTIEKELGNIADMERQIVSFLETEKEAEIEADIITLTDILAKYKYNWDNEHFITSNHKMVCDIQRSTRKNMIAYQKQTSDVLGNKQLLVANSKVNTVLNDMLKKFKYYRLALYTFSLSSMVEIMLSGNFKIENINAAIKEIEKNSIEYRTLFGECSLYLERISDNSIKTNILKGVGKASGTVGKVIGNIPKVKDGMLDDYLIQKGEKIKTNASDISKDILESFAEVSNPNTSIFVNKLNDMENIYNRTKEICFDEKNLYLVMEN